MRWPTVFVARGARRVDARRTDPRSFIARPPTLPPILCDNSVAVGPDASCTNVILHARVDTMTSHGSPRRFATANAGAHGALTNTDVTAPATPLTPATPLVALGEARWVFP